MSTTTPCNNDRALSHLRGLLRHFADLHNLVFQRDYRIVPATTRGETRATIHEEIST